MRSIEVKLEQANAAAQARIDARVERATATFAKRKRAEVVRIEARKANKRARLADQAIADLKSGKKKRRKRQASTRS